MPRQRRDLLRRSVALYCRIAGPSTLFAFFGALYTGYAYATANNYLAQHLEYVAVEFVLERVTSDCLFALGVSLVLFGTTLVSRERPRLATVVLPLFVAFHIFVLGSRVVVSVAWSTMGTLAGLRVPAVLTRAFYYGLSQDTTIDLLLLLLVSGVLSIPLSRYLRTRVLPAAWDLRSQDLSPGSLMLVGALCLVFVVGGVAVFTPRVEPGEPLNVIFVTWDSVRADHLSTYGYPRPTSPNVDRLAKDSVVFERAITQHNCTRPSYASMLTGLHSWEFPGHALGLEQLTLAEVLKNSGYRTFGYVQNPNLDAEFHFDQGFDFYRRLHESVPPRIMNEAVVKRVGELADSTRPFFLFVHYQEPHWPYRLDSPYVAEFTDAAARELPASRMYRLMESHGQGWDPDAPEAGRLVKDMLDLHDASIRSADEALGELISTLNALELDDNTLIVFNSDHGDEFNDRGQFGHAHRNLHPELTLTPLLIRFPKRLNISPSRISDAVQHLDIMPTILSTLEIPLPAALAGIPLPVVPGQSSGERVAFSNVGPLVLLRAGDFGLLQNVENGRHAFFDLANDPHETTPLEAPGDHPAYWRMKAQADRWHEENFSSESRSPSSEQPELSKELIERLKSLGYVR